MPPYPGPTPHPLSLRSSLSNACTMIMNHRMISMFQENSIVAFRASQGTIVRILLNKCFPFLHRRRQRTICPTRDTVRYMRTGYRTQHHTGSWTARVHQLDRLSCDMRLDGLSPNLQPRTFLPTPVLTSCIPPHKCWAVRQAIQPVVHPAHWCNLSLIQHCSCPSPVHSQSPALCMP